MRWFAEPRACGMIVGSVGKSGRRSRHAPTSRSPCVWGMGMAGVRRSRAHSSDSRPRTRDAAPPVPVYVDSRWTGQHGIGRYANEVLSRLSVGWTPLPIDGDPAGPSGMMRGIPAQARAGLVYSPGYNVVLRARRQVVTVHDLIHLRDGAALRYRAYYEGVLRPRIRRDGTVITVSETSRAAIAGWLRDDRVRIVNAGNGCSAAFRPDGPHAAAEEPYVLYVGNLRAHKNVDVLLDALAVCRGARLRMVVPRSESDDARGRIAARDLGPRVEVLCALDDDDLARQYRGAAATVLPTVYEGFGLPALESIRCGTPVVHWSGCEAVSETVGSRGIAVSSATDAAVWSDAIASMIASPQRVAAPLDDEFSWDRTASIVSGVLSELTDSDIAANGRSGR